MKVKSVLQAWQYILMGRAPSLSIEITRECPLRCPGCYAYNDAHLGGDTNLRSLADYKGEDLVREVYKLVEEKRPLHLSIVGGDPLVRYRELDELIPRLTALGTHVQVVTSAFREIPAKWFANPNFTVVVSIDGLQPEHDARRKPATYERILKTIKDAKVTIHSTITSFMMEREGYLEEFLRFWSANPSINKIWFSIFTPQVGESHAECLTPIQRERAVLTLLKLRKEFPKLDMHESAIKEFLVPPQSPSECIFALTTETISADLKTAITPCQFGGTPDCAQCGCVASMGLAAVGHHKVLGPLTAGHLFFGSIKIGKLVKKMRTPRRPEIVQQPDPESEELVQIKSGAA